MSICNFLKNNHKIANKFISVINNFEVIFQSFFMWIFEVIKFERIWWEDENLSYPNIIARWNQYYLEVNHINPCICTEFI